MMDGPEGVAGVGKVLIKHFAKTKIMEVSTVLPNVNIERELHGRWQRSDWHTAEGVPVVQVFHSPVTLYLLQHFCEILYFQPQNTPAHNMVCKVDFQLEAVRC